MPIRVQWKPDHSVGHGLIDAQHQGLLDQCNQLADLCQHDGDHLAFAQAYHHLKSLALAHFETELALLARGGYVALEDHRNECDEFAYLTNEIATDDKFERIELQRFVALWWSGHVHGTVEPQRACFLEMGPST